MKQDFSNTIWVFLGWSAQPPILACHLILGMVVAARMLINSQHACAFQIIWFWIVCRNSMYPLNTREARGRQRALHFRKPGFGAGSAGGRGYVIPCCNGVISCQFWLRSVLQTAERWYGQTFPSGWSLDFNPPAPNMAFCCLIFHFCCCKQRMGF